MRLSTSVLAICANRYGEGAPFELDIPTDVAVSDYTEDMLEEVFDELVTSGLLVVDDESAHLSSLARLYLDMMIKPEVFISLYNRLTNMRANLYVSDARYLCVIDSAADAPERNEKRLLIDLLPDLKQVVGLFVYMIHLDSKQVPADETRGETHQQADLLIRGMAWNRLRELINEWHVDGFYLNDAILYNVSEKSGDHVRNEEPTPYEDSAAINKVTEWLFARLSESMQEEGDVR